MRSTVRPKTTRAIPCFPLQKSPPVQAAASGNSTDVLFVHVFHRDRPLAKREYFASLAGRRTLHLLFRLLEGVGCLFRPRSDTILALDHSSCCYQTSSRFEAKLVKPPYKTPHSFREFCSVIPAPPTKYPA